MNNIKKSVFSEITTIPPILDRSYYPSLNGIRGIAIIIVVIAHLNLSSGLYYDMLFNAHTGVLIFFVLSGFLITTLCIKEKVLTKDISLKNFYLRRGLRILPVAYLYLIAICVLNFIYKLDVSYISLLGAAFFLMDLSSFFRKYYFSWYTGHYWSLAVEEQFYLIVPIILKKHFKLYLALLLFITLVLPVFFCLQYFFPALNTGVLYTLTHFLIKFQSIAVGCLFSIVLFKYPFTKTMHPWLKTITNIAAFFIIIIIRYNDFISLQSMFSSLIISVLTGYIITTNLTTSNDVVFKILNSKILVTIGILSYSIYIWQQLFTSYSEKLPHLISGYPYNIIGIIVISCASYYLYERFFLKIKLRFTRLNNQPSTN